MLLKSANGEQKFQISRYIIPVLSFYLLPWVLMYLNLLPIPPRITKSNNFNITATKGTVTTCKNDISQFEESGSINCTGKNCNMNKEIICPRSSDKPDMVYCCHHSKHGKTWVDCCDANTYGILHHTTSNVVLIYLIILSAIFALVCCPCSPMFRQFRQKLFRVCRPNK